MAAESTDTKAEVGLCDMAAQPPDTQAEPRLFEIADNLSDVTFIVEDRKLYFYKDVPLLAEYNMDLPVQVPHTRSLLVEEPGPFEEEDDMTDVAFQVEDKKLYMNKAVLSIASPVFKAMFTADFKEKSASEIPLPGKKLADVVLFFKQFHPVYCADPITDASLQQLLPLADEYQTESVRKKCQLHILNQIRPQSNKMTNDVLLLYLWVCDQYQLTEPRGQLLALGAQRELQELQRSRHYASVPAAAVRDLAVQRALKLETLVKEAVDKLSSFRENKPNLQIVCTDCRTSTGICTKCASWKIKNLVEMLRKGP